MDLDLVDPTGTTSRENAQPASRLATLDGKVIGLLDIGKNNSKEIIGSVVDAIKGQYAVCETLWRHKNYVTFPSGSQPAPAEMLDYLSRQCDCVIVGVGD